MGLTAHLYKINPEYDIEIASIILNKGEYEYDKYTKEDGVEEPLKLFVKEIEENKWGKFVKALLDTVYRRVSRVYINGELKPIERVFRETYPLYYQVYNEIGSSPTIFRVLSIFSKEWLAVKFRDAIEKIIRKEPALLKTRIRIDSTNEEKIRDEFDDVKRVSLKDMDDDRLKTMGLGGKSRVYETEEWRKAFHIYRGLASFIGVNLDGIWFYLSEKGTLIVRKNIDMQQFVEYYVPEIMKRLTRANAIVFS